MSLNIQNLHEVLDNATPLAGMGIKIIEISRDGDRAVYAAEIPANGYVTPHFHPDLNGGTEWYEVFEAGDDAIMYTGKPVYNDTEVINVDWGKPNKISERDYFVVPNGVVHSLFAGKMRLRFIFGCPDAHLDNDRDKVVLEKFLPIKK